MNDIKLKFVFLSILAFVAVIFILAVLVPSDLRNGYFYAAAFLTALSVAYLFIISTCPGRRGGFRARGVGIGFSLAGCSRRSRCSHLSFRSAGS